MDLDRAKIVALGSNLSGGFDSSAAVVEAALARLADLRVKPVRVSSLWRSSAWPDPNDPEYVNAVALVETTLPPRPLLALLHRIEVEFGPRSTARNAPRVLDLDLIAYGRKLTQTPSFTVPHPRAAERRFVMGPLSEIAPDWIHPALGLSARQLVVDAAIARDAAAQLPPPALPSLRLHRTH